MVECYIIKDHKGNTLEHKVNKINRYNSNGCTVMEIILKDPFDITTATVGEIIERLNENSDELISYQYDGGILYLPDWHNLDKLIHDLNIPYYNSPWHTNLIEGQYLKNRKGIFLNLRSLKKHIKDEREKGNVKNE